MLVFERHWAAASKDHVQYRTNAVQKGTFRAARVVNRLLKVDDLTVDA
jgi:hypothetical protein